MVGLKRIAYETIRVGPYSGGASVHKQPINGFAFRWGVGPSLGGDSINCFSTLLSWPIFLIILIYPLLFRIIF
jgi:hypothetical protein